MTQGQSASGLDALYVYCQAEGGRKEDVCVGEIAISMLDGGVTVQAKSPNSYMPSLFL